MAANGTFEPTTDLELSAVGKAELTLDDFYQSKLPPFRPEPEISYIPDNEA
ncbi:hypothetical protein [Rhizobium sp. ICMP 5592]|uniref:hypothetical protein n=1 Tax=Rhizobium sp. ICMP 5592 TaxID=2292445 RepID=UPI001296E5DA|nr:hypothetical protein [Rhizobium sp. ICMP 5592]